MGSPTKPTGPLHRSSPSVAAAAGARRRRTLAGVALAVVTALSAAACAAAPAPSATPALSATPSETSAAVDASTLRTLIDAPVETPSLTEIGPAEPVGDETATEIAYVSGGLTITGVLRIPEGDGPFPAVVVVHGSVDPDGYETGRDLVSEQQALIDNGYAVLATDMRGYAGSDAGDAENNPAVDPGLGHITVLDPGLTLDVVNALRLLRNGEVAEVDSDRIGVLGHSLGGFVAMSASVIAPGSSDVVIALSSLSSSWAVTFSSSDQTTDAGPEVLNGFGTPANNPGYWTDVSPLTFVDRVTEPLLLIHGGADDATLPEWSVQTAEAWNAAGKSADVVILDGADHSLQPRQGDANEIIITAFDDVLGAGE